MERCAEWFPGAKYKIGRTFEEGAEFTFHIAFPVELPHMTRSLIGYAYPSKGRIATRISVRSAKKRMNAAETRFVEDYAVAHDIRQEFINRMIRLVGYRYIGGTKGSMLNFAVGWADARKMFSRLSEHVAIVTGPVDKEHLLLTSKTTMRAKPFAGDFRVRISRPSNISSEYSKEATAIREYIRINMRGLVNRYYLFLSEPVDYHALLLRFPTLSEYQVVMTLDANGRE